MSITTMETPRKCVRCENKIRVPLLESFIQVCDERALKGKVSKIKDPFEAISFPIHRQ